jgi:tocopherol O-methyltransferase
MNHHFSPFVSLSTRVSPRTLANKIPQCADSIAVLSGGATVKSTKANVECRLAGEPKMRAAAVRERTSCPNDKQKIIKHYDVVSPFYRSLWGDHIHHGYWIRGDESKEKAQLQLIEHLAQLADVKPGSDVLDIGCGMGASSLHLVRTYGANATGITISPVQVEIANKAAAAEQLSVKFLLMDAEAMDFQNRFDLVWCVEAISHFERREEFFAAAAKLLRPGGTFAIIDWFKKDDLTPSEIRKFIDPIENGMLAKLQVMDAYESLLASNGLKITHREVLNEHCAKTWDLCIDILRDKELWKIAVQHGAAFVAHLRAFQAMRAGFASGNFVYGLFVASAPSNTPMNR